MNHPTEYFLLSERLQERWDGTSRWNSRMIAANLTNGYWIAACTSPSYRDA